MSTNTKINSENLWTFQYIIIIILSAIIIGFNQMYVIILPLYIIDIGSSVVMSGLVTTAFSLAALIFRVPSGTILDKKGVKTPLLAGFMVCVATTAVLGIIPIVAVLIVIRIVFGVGFSFASTAIGKAAADNIPKTRMMEGIGMIGLFTGLAGSLGTSGALALTNKFGYTPFFVISVVVMLFGFFLSMILVKKTKQVDSKALENSIQKPQKRKGIWEKNAISSVIVLALIVIGICASSTFLAPYCKELGISGISIFYLITAGSSVAVRLIFGKIADRHGPSVVMIPTLFLVIISFILLAFLKSNTGLYIIGVLYGGIAGILLPTLQGIIIHLCPGRTGSANALYLLSFDVGFIFGGFTLGFLVSAFGYRTMFIITAGVICISFLMYIFSVAKKLKTQDV